MGYIGSALTYAWIIFLGFLSMWANDMSIPVADRHVLTTSVYSLGGATMVNTACVLIGAQYNLVEPAGAEMEACVPYTLATAGVIARIYMWSTGGFREEEWAYVKSTPYRAFRLAGTTKDYVMGLWTTTSTQAP
ncbi:hypothetical protein GQ53DRAFT_750542 [Thozetella sp. PMI_491]|nr:hypothetical protein GQ53DRAFT_750542 [Thozetella sp. PMI_491]